MTHDALVLAALRSGPKTAEEVAAIVLDEWPEGFLERFTAKVEIDSETGCWTWTGSRSHGYGQVWAGRRSRAGHPQPDRAHRVSYRLLVGDIPSGLTLDHLCRNRACVNPAHLEPVTNRENVLRGAGTSAQNARKDTCHKGHPFDEANTTYLLRGGRLCKACARHRGRIVRERAGIPARWPGRIDPKFIPFDADEQLTLA